MPMRIAGGVVVAPDGVREEDVVLDAPGEDVDARGRFVLPGGVDPHAHPLPDLRAATEAAARGGTTTVLAFTNPLEDETPTEAFVRARDELLPGAVVNVELHATIRSPDRLDRAELERLAAEGARAVKLYLAYPELDYLVSDRTLYETLRDATELSMLVKVHCESSGAIDALVEERLAAGDTGVRGFVASRPPLVEEEGVARTLAYAELANAPVYLVHLTSARSLDLVREARARGRRVWAEATTHHLVLDESRYDGDDAADFVVVPPLRSRADVEALWDGIADGTIDTIGSDHAQARYVPDAPPGDFRALAYGFFGIDARVPLVLSEGTRRGVPLERLADLLSWAPLRAFGHESRGAGLVVWDPQGRTTLARPFADVAVTGAIRDVFLGGRRVG
jgi:dihydropyrimidinase